MKDKFDLLKARHKVFGNNEKLIEKKREVVATMMYANMTSDIDRKKFRQMYPEYDHIYDNLKKWVGGERERFIQLSLEERELALEDLDRGSYWDVALITHEKLSAAEEGREPATSLAKI